MTLHPPQGPVPPCCCKKRQDELLINASGPLQQDPGLRLPRTAPLQPILDWAAMELDSKFIKGSSPRAAYRGEELDQRGSAPYRLLPPHAHAYNSVHLTNLHYGVKSNTNFKSLGIINDKIHMKVSQFLLLSDLKWQITG